MSQKGERDSKLGEKDFYDDAVNSQLRRKPELRRNRGGGKDRFVIK